MFKGVAAARRFGGVAGKRAQMGRTWSLCAFGRLLGYCVAMNQVQAAFQGDKEFTTSNGDHPKIERCALISIEV